MKYDFSGWATRANMKCSDGRVIMKDAFKHEDGMVVPLVWNHQHGEASNVLGHALLENREDGVYTYGSFNDTDDAQIAKQLVKHGDITALSIYANRLKQNGVNVMHGDIREVSLVLAGANPGAYIDSVMMHGSDCESEGMIYTDEVLDPTEGDIQHSNIMNEKPKKEEKPVVDNKPETKPKTDPDTNSDDGETVEEVFNTLTEKQKNVVCAILGAALENGQDNEDDEEGGEEEMKHNAFDGDYTYENPNVLSHADGAAIVQLAKAPNVGSLQTAMQIYADDNNLQHDGISGFVQEGTGNVTSLFPEYQEVRPGAPELITNDQGWVGVVMNKVHKSPISRIRTSQVDIRNIDALRARGYKKGVKKKIDGNLKLIRRTTDPQTVYVKNALHRDDIVDITDFDYVQYLYNIDKTNLNEELAVAIMLGDGRDEGDEDKIFPEHIRPIWLDDDLYTIHVDMDIAAAKKELQGTNTGANFGETYIYAEAMINACLYAREKYKGTGTPDLFIAPHSLNRMLLARDINGRRIYSSTSELASALNVGAIHTAEQFEGKTRTTDAGKKKQLYATIVNLDDYSLGATKGGEVTHFTQFDIDFNQEKSLLETRVSGALTRVYSAIAIEEDVTDLVKENQSSDPNSVAG